MSATKIFSRFSLGQRIEHILLILSFTTLCLTGLPQKYVGQGWAEGLIGLMGGIELVRIIHRIAATVLCLETIYHLALLGYKLFVLRLGWSMLPSVKDARDGVQAFLYNLGLGKHRPRMGRYTFDEKMEYWALIWGLVVMVLTGFMLWNPIATANILPGQFIPASKAAHGGEALLAFLAILIWHTYHVHLRGFNKSIWNGKLTEEEMVHDHPLELEQIQAGNAQPVVSPQNLARRRKVYYPVAGIVTVVLVVATFYFVTFEKSAVTTIPPAETAVAFSPQTPTPIPTAQAAPTMAPAQPDAALTWDGPVSALFEQKCGACHGAMGGLSVKTFADLMKGGAKGAVIVPGKPDDSSLVQLQASGSHPGLFTAGELAQIKDWITAGAPEK